VIDLFKTPSGPMHHHLYGWTLKLVIQMTGLQFKEEVHPQIVICLILIFQEEMQWQLFN
jgi:hypothetical protein